MRSSEIIRYLIIGIVIVLIQSLLFRGFTFGWERFNYIHFIIYPIFLFMLPFRMSRASLILAGAIIGFLVDMFYQSPGVHMSATVFTAFMRPYILKYLEPRGGYNVNDTPITAKLGVGWYLSFTAVLMALHLFFYFSVEVFTFYHMLEIWLKTLFSFIFSMAIVIMHGILVGAIKFN